MARNSGIFAFTGKESCNVFFSPLSGVDLKIAQKRCEETRSSLANSINPYSCKLTKQAEDEIWGIIFAKSVEQ